MTAPSSLKVDDALRAEVWLAHEALKPICDDLSQHRGESKKDHDALLSKLEHLRDELSHLPKRGVQMCAILLAPHLVGLLQWYTVSKNLSMQDTLMGSVVTVIEALLQTLVVFLDKIERVDVPFSESLFLAISRLLTPPNRPQPDGFKKEMILERSWESQALFAHFSEEARRAVSQVVQISSEKLSAASVALIAQPKCLPAIFFITHQLLEIATRDRNRENQSMALKALQQVCKIPFGPAPVSSILPGLLASCGRIILGDYKQGKEVFVQAFRLMAIAVTTAMNDEENATLEALAPSSSADAMAKLRNMMNSHAKDEKPAPTPETDQKKHAGPPSLPSARRDKTWFKNATYHVQMMLSRLFSISRLTMDEQSRNISMNAIVVRSPSVRLEMATTAAEILSRCRRTLASTTPVLFEVLVLFAFDDQPDVAAYCEAQLKALTSNFGDAEKSHLLRSVFSDNLVKLVHSLPRLIRDPEDNKKLLVLRLTTGYYRILGNTPSVLPALCQALTQLLELESNDLRLVHRNINILLLEGGAEASTTTNDASSTDLANVALHEIQQSYRRNFVHFRDEKVFQALIGIARQLGASCDLDLLFDLLMKLVTENADGWNLGDDDQEVDRNTLTWKGVTAAPALLLLNEIMLGASGFVDPDSFARVKLSRDKQRQLKSHWEHYLSFLMSEEVWNRSRDVKRSEDVYYMIFLLEGVGNMAMVFGSAFSGYLMKTLYQVLQRAGSDYSLLAHAAKLSLVRLALHSGYPDIPSLLNSNMDFVVDAIVHELRYTQDMDGALKVLGAVLRIASQLMIPLLDDLLDDIFRGLDLRHDQYNRSFLTILHGVIAVVAKQPHRSRKQIRAENHARRAQQTSSNAPSAPIATSKDKSPDSQAKEDIVEDFTLHNWIRRCDRNYCDLKSVLVSSPPADDTEQSYLEDEYGSIIKSELNFTMKAFLKSRIKRRLNEVELFKVDKDSGPKTAEEFFKEHHKQKEEEEERGDDLHKGSETTGEGMEAEEESDEEWEENASASALKPRLRKKPHRPGYDFVLKIMTKLQHWMNIRDLETRVIVLDTIRVGITILAEHKKALLPMIHTLWSPLQWRFLDADYRIANKSLEIMTTMARFGKSFVARRFLDDLWPLLKQMITMYNVYSSEGAKNIAKLNVASQYSKFTDAQSAFKMSQSYKVQSSALSCIQSALENLKLPLPTIIDIASTCWFYLSEGQPQVLQDAACKMFRSLASLEPNNIWLLLVELSHGDTIPSTCAVELLKSSLEAGSPFAQLPAVAPLLTFAPDNFRRSGLAVSAFYAQFQKNASSVLATM